MGKKVVVALGGNAILQPGQRGTAEEQFENARKTCKQIVGMVRKGYDVVITHGNGPQVGTILIQNEKGSDAVPAMPLDVCGAESQGLIGYMIQQTLKNELILSGLEREVATVVTQVLVSPDDPAFQNPTKPIGPFYTEEEAKKRAAEKNETWIEDSGRGWRKVVPSPDPMGIVERNVIVNLVNSGVIVIASGGGGIPVVRKEDETLVGVEAVIDKDLAGERLAQDVGADIFLILTDVSHAMINYGTPEQKELKDVTVEELEKYQEEGHFKAGSMGPKVKAILRFVRGGGEEAIISSLDRALDALEGKVGTRVRRR